MKLVVYLLKKILPLFLGSLVFIALVLNLVDLFMHIATYLQNGCKLNEVVSVMIFYIPKTIWYAVPVAILFSTSYVLSDMYACNELEALFASGVSLLRFTAPILIISIVLSFGLFIFENNLVVQTYEKKVTLQDKLLGKKEEETTADVNVLSDGGRIIYNAKVYFDSTHYLMELYIIFRDEHKNLEAIIYADGANWNDDLHQWVLRNPVQYAPVNGNIQFVPVSDEFTSRLTEHYSIFRKTNVDISAVNAKEAKLYIAHLRKAGLPYQHQLSEYYKKFAFPFIVFIVVFLSIGVTGKTKKYVLLISLASSVGSSVLFYVIMMVSMVLAKHGYITPFMGAWFPIVLFTFISTFLFNRART